MYITFIVNICKLFSVKSDKSFGSKLYRNFNKKTNNKANMLFEIRRKFMSLLFYGIDFFLFREFITKSQFRESVHGILEFFYENTEYRDHMIN